MELDIIPEPEVGGRVRVTNLNDPLHYTDYGIVSVDLDEGTAIVRTLTFPPPGGMGQKSVRRKLKKIGGTWKMSTLKTPHILTFFSRSTLTGVSEITKLILLNLDLRDLRKACQTDKYISQICQDEDFWRQKVERDFGREISSLKRREVSYREQYLDLDHLRMKFIFKDNLINALAKRRLDMVVYLLETFPEYRYIIRTTTVLGSLICGELIDSTLDQEDIRIYDDEALQILEYIFGILPPKDYPRTVQWIIVFSMECNESLFLDWLHTQNLLSQGLSYANVAEQILREERDLEWLLYFKRKGYDIDAIPLSLEIFHSHDPITRAVKQNIMDKELFEILLNLGAQFSSFTLYLMIKKDYPDELIILGFNNPVRQSNLIIFRLLVDINISVEKLRRMVELSGSLPDDSVMSQAVIYGRGSDVLDFLEEMGVDPKNIDWEDVALAIKGSRGKFVPSDDALEWLRRRGIHLDLSVKPRSKPKTSRSKASKRR